PIMQVVAIRQNVVEGDPGSRKQCSTLRRRAEECRQLSTMVPAGAAAYRRLAESYDKSPKRGNPRWPFARGALGDVGTLLRQRPCDVKHGCPLRIVGAGP